MLHYREVAMVFSNGDKLIQPVVTPFLECHITNQRSFWMDLYFT